MTGRPASLSSAPPGARASARWPRAGAVLFVAYTLAVFAGGCIRLSSSGGGGHWDKVEHFVAFTVMVPLASSALRSVRPEQGWTARLWTAVGLSVLLGGSLEIVQFLIPYRDCDWLDWAADSAGAVAAALSVGWVRRRAAEPARG